MAAMILVSCARIRRNSLTIRDCQIALARPGAVSRLKLEVFKIPPNSQAHLFYPGSHRTRSSHSTVLGRQDTPTFHLVRYFRHTQTCLWFATFASIHLSSCAPRLSYTALGPRHIPTSRIAPVSSFTCSRVPTYLTCRCTDRLSTGRLLLLKFTAKLSPAFPDASLLASFRDSTRLVVDLKWWLCWRLCGHCWSLSALCA